MIPTTSNLKKIEQMKKIFALGWMLVAALALTNCSKEETVAPAMENDFVVYANLDATRTVADGYSTSWVAGDNLNIFHAVAGETTYVPDGEFKLTNVEAGTFTGTVTGVEEGVSYDWYAYYPYDSHIQSPANTGSGYIAIAAQSQAQAGNDNTTHTSGAPLYGVVKGGSSSAPEFSMKHLSSMIKVNVTNTLDEAISIKSILVETAGTKISGTYYVDITGDAPAYERSGDNYTYSNVSLEVSGEEAINPETSAAFYLTVCPFEVEEGATETITVTVTDNSDEVSVRKYTIPAGKGFAPGKVTTLNFDFAAEVETEWTTIAEIHAASAEGTYNIKNVTVVAKGYYNLLLKDATGYLFSYQALDAEVGDIINITNALTSTYGERQIKSGAVVEKIGETEVTHPEATLLVNGAEFDAKSDNLTVGEYIQFEASSLTVSGNYTNLYVYGATRIGSAIRPATAFTSSTTPVLVTGYACYTYGQYLNIFVTEVVPVENYLYPASGNASIDADGTAKTIAVTTDNVNWTVEDDAEWLDAQNVNGVLTLTASQNTATEAREAKVVLTHATADITRIVVISQSGAPATGAIYYQKVTSTPSDWSGTYLIVNEDESFVFDGSLSKLDASNNFKEVTIADSAIEATEEINGYAFTISAGNDGYTIKSASGYYIGQTSDANGLKSSTTTSYSNTLTLNADGSVHIVSGNAYLRFNTTAGQDRFRYYKSSTFSNQNAITLYKLSE